MKYRRFQTLAEAVKYAVEDMRADPSRIVIRTDAGEFTGTAIRKIYDDVDFPLPRGARLEAVAPRRSA